MEKIKLKDGTVFDIVPMGIDIKIAEKVKVFRFVSTLTYEEIKAIIMDSEKLSTIDYIGADNLVSSTYQDCVKMLSLSFIPNYVADNNTTLDIYKVTISTDEVLRNTETMKSQIDDIFNAIVMLTMI